MQKSKTKKISQKLYLVLGVVLLIVGLVVSAGCSSSASQPAPAAQAQPSASGNDENSFKASCQELQMRGLDKNYTQYIKKPVKAEGPIMEVQSLNDGRSRLKIQYPDTDAIWVTTEKALFTKPKVGKRATFWGILEGRGEKSKAAEVSAKYINII